MQTVNDHKYFNAKHEGYQVSDEDVDSVDADTTYTLYVNRLGEWYIMKEDITVGGDADLKVWRFIKGDSDSSTSWAGREGLSYATFQATFA